MTRDVPLDRDPGGAELLLHELRARLVRGVKRGVRPLWMARLRERNLHSAEPVVAPGGPAVSLTTIAARLPAVFHTIESIGCGVLKPSRLVLWLDERLVAAGVPEALVRLQSRGLEVRGCQDVGPHTKYFPQVREQPAPAVALATADDDQLYPRDWLSRLARAAAADANAIHCFRAHRMAFEPDGSFQPYIRWRRCRSQRASHLHFATGVSGVIHPPRMQQALARHGLAFLESCPRADDIWINVVALRERLPVRQVVPLARAFFEIPGTRSQGLARDNRGAGGNDAQLARAYTDAERRELCRLDAASARA